MKKELRVISINKLHPYKNNPRDNEAAIPDVAESIRQCGYISPIVVDEDGVILAGHTRYYALTEIGITEVPVLICTGLTEEQKKAYRVLDNLLNELAYWDYGKLPQELDGVDFQRYAFGFEKLTEKMDQDISGGYEFEMEDFADDTFKHECPECGFRFN